MKRKGRSGASLAAAEFDGRKVRSALKWRILATLVGRVAAPMAAAQIYEFIRTGSSRNFSEWFHRLQHPSHVYVYLYRMAEEGLVELSRADAALAATLTERGRREVERYSAYWGERGVGSPDALAWGQRSLSRGGVKPPPVAAPKRPGRPAEPAPPPASPPAGETAEGGRALRRAGPLSLAARCRSLIRRRDASRPREGFGGATGFVSYDLPMPEHGRRRHLLAVLKAAGYGRVHDSMYAGPGRDLKAVVSTLEAAGLAPHVRWGSLRLMPR